MTKTPAWDAFPATKAEIMALKALAAGNANVHQQKRALSFILHTACRLNSVSFDPTSERISAFNDGRRWVGMQVQHLINTPIDKLSAQSTKKEQ